METQNLEIKTGIQIQKPVHEVFDAIVEPEKMINYFISKSSGKIEEGKKIIWKFPEWDDEIPIRVVKVDPDKYISYYWSQDDIDLLVEMTLKPVENDQTVVIVTEKSMKNDEAGIKWLKGNTEGWANFLACLKAYVEYGINLRKGCFDYMKTMNT